MLAFGVELLALDAFARGRTRALALVPLAHLLWTNSHQLWPLSLVIQAMFVADLAWQRDGRRARLAALALVASVLLTFATPLGFRIVLAPLRTAQSLAIFRDHVDEFHRIWTMSHELGAGAGDRRARGVGAVAHAPRDAAVRMGLWLLSLALVVSAVRGLMFFGVVSVAVFQRCVLRANAAGETLLPPLSAVTRRFLRRRRPDVHGDGGGRRGLLPLGEPAARAGRNAARLRPRDRRLGGGGDRLHPRRAPARAHVEPGHGPRRRRPVLGARHPGVRRFAPGVVPARIPRRRAGRAVERRRAGQADRSPRSAVAVRQPRPPRPARSHRHPVARRLAGRLRRQRPRRAGASHAGNRRTTGARTRSISGARSPAIS